MHDRGFTFDAKTHAYARDGVCIPSVTRILDHSGLVNFDMVRRDVLERKSTIGTLVHLATHYYDIGTLDFESLDDYTKGRTEAWINFRADTGFVPRLIEKRYLAEVNGMTYGLTVDREGLLRKQECIVEIKTSASIENWHAIQCAGYALGVPDFEGRTSSPRVLFARRRRMVVQLLADGRYKKKDFEDPRDADVFMSGLHISHWKMAHGEPIKEIEE